MFCKVHTLCQNIYLSELNVEKGNKLDDQTNYLDLTFIIANNNRLYTKRYDKRDDFNLHSVNFPFLSSNIPFGPSCGVYILQHVRHARCCTYSDHFGYRHKLPVHSVRSQLETCRMIRSLFSTVDLCCEGFVDFHDLQDLSLGMSI